MSNILNGMSGFGWDKDNNTITDATKNPLFTYQTIETPVNTINSEDNVELLKKNGELIGKYFKEFKDLFDKASKDEESKKLLDMDILNRLNEFAYDRDKLFVDNSTVSIPTVWTEKDWEREKNAKITITTNTGDTNSRETYKILNTAEQAYNYPKPRNQQEFEAQQKEKQSSLYEKKLNSNFDKNIEVASNKDFNRKPRDDDFDRSLSLTYAEVKNGDKWFAEHRKKYHKKRLQYLKKNPFAGGVSPVADCYWKWTACSIGTSCDIVCTECERKYLKIKEEHKKAVDFYDQYKEDNKSIINSSGIQAQLKSMKKNIDKMYKEENKLYKQAYFELRELDE